jgi:hypothetical protein
MNLELLKKTQWLATLCTAAVLLAGCLPAAAQIVTTPITPLPFTNISETAASTLLIPYFEVDLGNANGRKTIVTVDNGWTPSPLTEDHPALITMSQPRYWPTSRFGAIWGFQSSTSTSI